ncbi:hypothetical protein BH23BAC1_BH23BAC1_09450 [soil metagenome]
MGNKNLTGNQNPTCQKFPLNLIFQIFLRKEIFTLFEYHFFLKVNETKFALPNSVNLNNF